MVGACGHRRHRALSPPQSESKSWTRPECPAAVVQFQGRAIAADWRAVEVQPVPRPGIWGPRQRFAEKLSNT